MKTITVRKKTTVTVASIGVGLALCAVVWHFIRGKK